MRLAYEAGLAIFLPCNIGQAVIVLIEYVRWTYLHTEPALDAALGANQLYHVVITSLSNTKKRRSTRIVFLR